MTPFAPTTRDTYDRLLATLLGRRVLRVVYFECDFDENAPHWGNDSPSFDSLDLGLELHLDDDEIFSFTWGSEFAPYGLAIGRGRMPVSEDVRKWDVTERWAGVLTGPLREASCMWEGPVSGSDIDGTPTLYPQNIALRFGEGGNVIIAAFQFGNGLYVGADHVAVFFDEAEARKLTGCG